MAKNNTFDYDLIVIGSGASGSTAATIAASRGKSVAIIESSVLGGDSANWSDVPAKALLHAANLYDEARHGARFGLRSATLGYNYPSIRAWKNLAVKRTGAGGNRSFYENRKISVFSGAARFISPNEISVNRRHLSAKYFLVATGSTDTLPSIPGLADANCLTPRTVLETLRPPKSLLIIGGNDDGVEIAQLLATFGTKVYIVEESDRLLPTFDKEASELVERVFAEKKGVTTIKKAQVVAIEKAGLDLRAIISRGGHEKSIKIEKVLVANGRQPAVDLGLDNANVQYSPQGILVNEYLQTSNKHVFAAGDVLGGRSGTQVAFMEGRIATNNILSRNKLTPNYSNLTDIVFTNPGVAMTGLSEKDCQTRKIKIKKAIAPLNAITRSNTSDFRDGFIKIITNQKGVILGATVVAPHAAEIIHELTLAISCQLTATDIASTPHAFLSWSEAVQVCANNLL